MDQRKEDLPGFPNPEGNRNVRRGDEGAGTIEEPSPSDGAGGRGTRNRSSRWLAGGLPTPIRPLSEPVGPLHHSKDGRHRSGSGPGPGSLHSGHPPPPSLRYDEEVLYLGLHHRQQPIEERASKQVAKPPGPLPEAGEQLG